MLVNVKIPKGKKAEWVNDVLTLVDDSPTFVYKILTSNGSLSKESYSSKSVAEEHALNGENVVRIESSSKIQLPNIHWEWLISIVGGALFIYGIYQLVFTNNDSADTPLWTIIGEIAVGILLTVLSFKK